jgi:hypothetical protein
MPAAHGGLRAASCYRGRKHMAANASSVHPRKLYDMLVACPSPESRARAAFDFMRGRASSDGGFMFLVRSGELQLAASSHQNPPPSDLLEEARRTFRRERDTQPDDSLTRTLDMQAIEAVAAPAENPGWKSETLGVGFEKRVLGTYRGARWLPIGVVFLKASGALVPIRHVHIEAITNAIIDAGDLGKL